MKLQTLWKQVLVALALLAAGGPAWVAAAEDNRVCGRLTTYSAMSHNLSFTLQTATGPVRWQVQLDGQNHVLGDTVAIRAKNYEYAIDMVKTAFVANRSVCVDRYSRDTKDGVDKVGSAYSISLANW